MTRPSPCCHDYFSLPDHSSCCHCCSAPCRADTPAQALDKILDAPALQGGIIGAEVARVSDGQVVYTRNPDTRLMPASNRKLFTAAAALELLGDDFTLKTDVLAPGKPDAQGMLHGDLTLRGGGDGLLSVADLDDLARQMAQAGVRHVTGGVCGDGTLFSDGPYGEGWEWDDLSDDYAPQISALEVNEGFVTAHVTAGAEPGDLATVTVDPPGYICQSPTAPGRSPGSGPSDVQVFRPYDANYLVVTGNIPLASTVDETATVADPGALRGDRLPAGIGAAGHHRRWPRLLPLLPPELGRGGHDLLASHQSLPLAQYLAKMNKPSDNLLAESLFRMLGAVKGHGGTYAAGAAVAGPFFQSLGIDTGTLTLADGSGVSRRNFVTARAVTRLLVAMHGKPDWKAFYDSLPIAGVDGTLRRRMAGTPAAGNVHAKTGSLTGASCLSGYVTARDGTLYAFSLLLNNFPRVVTRRGRCKMILWVAGGEFVRRMAPRHQSGEHEWAETVTSGSPELGARVPCWTTFNAAPGRRSGRRGRPGRSAVPRRPGRPAWSGRIGS